MSRAEYVRTVRPTANMGSTLNTDAPFRCRLVTATRKLSVAGVNVNANVAVVAGGKIVVD